MKPFGLPRVSWGAGILLVLAGLPQASLGADTQVAVFSLAFLGERDAALAEAQRAAELLPESKDAFGGPEVMEGVAQVYAILGEKDRAIEVLNGLLSRPSAMTVEILKVNPVWDPLRDDPEFQNLLTKYGGKA